MLASLTFIARLVLAATFLVAGVAKLLDREGSRKAMRDFGAPARLAGALAVAVPLAELVVAGLLLPASTALYGALGAAILLIVFTTALVVSLARGQAPDCHCFGQLHSAPASWKTVARNLALAGVAVFAVAGSASSSDTSATAWIGDLDGSELVALAVAAAALLLLSVGGFAFFTLMRSYGRILVRLDHIEAALAENGIDVEPLVDEPELGLEPGTPAPAFELASTTGKTVTLESLTAADVPTLLVFTSPHCGPCKTLLPLAATWQEEHAGELAVVFASDAPAAEARAEAEEFELETMLVDDERTLYAAYEGNGTPSAVLIAPDGTIGSWLAAGAEAIERLVARTLTGPGEDQGLPVGTPAPAVTLPTLDGEQVSLDETHDSLLLFWNPDCGFCRSMHEDLLEWERRGNGEGPQLVVVSSGEAESTRAEGFSSLVLLDESFDAGTAFGANGTPMAVLIDADGRIASGVVAGAEAVLELANGR